MKNEQAQVREFMVKAGQETPAIPSIPSKAVRELRVRLIAEELLELCEALSVNLRLDNTPGKEPVFDVKANECLKLISSDETCNVCDAYDAVLDILVVTIGTGISLGLDLEPGWQEVHSSNMSKFVDGWRRPDGKWQKGPSYKPARLQPIIDAQILEATNPAPKALVQNTDAQTEPACCGDCKRHGSALCLCKNAQA